MRLFSNNAFIAAARIEISEQIKYCGANIIELSNLLVDISKKDFNNHKEQIFNEINAGIQQAKSLFDIANKMLANIENFLVKHEFPTSDEMQESIKNSGAQIEFLADISEYNELDDDLKEKFAFVASNYELISKILDSAIELCAVLNKAAKSL